MDYESLCDVLTTNINDNIKTILKDCISDNITTSHNPLLNSTVVYQSNKDKMIKDTFIKTNLFRCK